MIEIPTKPTQPVKYIRLFNNMLYKETPFMDVVHNICVQYIAETNAPAEIVEQIVQLEDQLTFFFDEEIEAKDIECNEILPIDLQLLFKRIIAQAEFIMKAKDPIIAKYSDMFDKEENSSESLLAVICLLESDMLNNKIENWHVKQVQKQLNNWLMKLPNKVCELILKSNHIDELKEKIQKSLLMKHPDSIVLRKFCYDMDVILQNNFFFNGFYCKENIVSQYEYILSHKEKYCISDALSKILDILLKTIEHQLYLSCKLEKQKLMANGSSVHAVFEKLSIWVQEAWFDYPVVLCDQLLQKLSDEEDEYLGWEEVDEVLHNKMQTPMYILNTMRYRYNFKDPKKIIEDYYFQNQTVDEEIEEPTHNNVEDMGCYDDSPMEIIEPVVQIEYTKKQKRKSW